MGGGVTPPVINDELSGIAVEEPREVGIRGVGNRANEPGLAGSDIVDVELPPSPLRWNGFLSEPLIVRNALLARGRPVREPRPKRGPRAESNGSAESDARAASASRRDRVVRDTVSGVHGWLPRQSPADDILLDPVAQRPYAATSLHNLVDAARRNGDILHQAVLGECQGVEEVGEHDFPRMDGRESYCTPAAAAFEHQRNPEVRLASAHPRP
jgi:hypothetical protein